MAIAVTNDASAFKRTANLPASTAFTMWGWFMATTDRNAFTGFLGLVNAVDGVSYIEIGTSTDGTSVELFTHTAHTPLVNISLNTWYFFAMTRAASAGAASGYYRTLAQNTLTTVTAACGNYTAGAMEWGRDGFTGEFLVGQMHAFGSAEAALSADELLELSYFHEPQLDGIRSLNCFYPCIESVNTNATIDRSGNGRDATATAGSLTDSPALLWRPVPPPWNLPATAASGAITGAIDLTIAITGAMTGAGALTGAVPLTITPVGALTGAGALLGSVPLSFTPVGALTGAGALVGSVALAVTPTGALTGNGALTGSATITFAVSGTLANADSGAIAGSIASTLTVVGALTGTGDLAGSIALDFGVLGSLSGGAIPVPEQSSGGFFFDFEVHRFNRQRRKKREQEIEQEEAQIQAELDREIAHLLHEQEARDAERADLARIQSLADRFAGTKQPVPRRIAATLIKAQEERTSNSLLQLQREMERMYDEEELAVMLILNS